MIPIRLLLLLFTACNGDTGLKSVRSEQTGTLVSKRLSADDPAVIRSLEDKSVLVTGRFAEGRALIEKSMTPYEKIIFPMGYGSLSGAQLSDRQSNNIINGIDQYIRYLEYKISKSGISVDRSAIVELQDRRFVIDLTFANSDGRTMSHRFVCFINFRMNEMGDAALEDIYGCDVAVSEEELILTDLEGITAYDLATLRILDKRFALPRNMDHKIVLTGTEKRGSRYYSLYFESKQNTGIVEFEENGEFRDRYRITSPESLVYAEMFSSWEYNYPFGSLRKVSCYPAPDGRTIICRTTGSNPDAILDKITGSWIPVYDFIEFTSADGVLLRVDTLLKNCTDSEPDSVLVTAEKNGELEACFKCEVKINPLYGFALRRETKDTYGNAVNGYTVTEDGSFILENNYLGEKIIIDLSEQSVSVDDNYGRSQLDTLIASNDRGEIWSGSRAGGGDLILTNILYSDKAHENIQYIGTIGGMYGGDESAGFFSNGDIYFFGHERFDVFRAEGNNIKKRMSFADRFPLGKNPEEGIYYRMIHAVRRDPETMGYTVIYSEERVNETGRYLYDNTQSDGTELRIRYKIGFLDSTGRLLESFESDRPVRISAFGPLPVEMWKEGEVYRFNILDNRNRIPVLTGQFDTQTNRFYFKRSGQQDS